MNAAASLFLPWPSATRRSDGPAIGTILCSSWNVVAPGSSVTSNWRMRSIERPRDELMTSRTFHVSPHGSATPSAYNVEHEKRRSSPGHDARRGRGPGKGPQQATGPPTSGSQRLPALAGHRGAPGGGPDRLRRDVGGSPPLDPPALRDAAHPRARRPVIGTRLRDAPFGALLLERSSAARRVRPRVGQSAA